MIALAPTRAEEGRETCAHCGAKLTDEEREFYGNGCETCEGRLHAALVADDLRAALEPTEVQRAEARAAHAEAEVARLKARLEIDHAYDGAGNRIPFPEGMDHLDGIACRDETIKLVEAEVARLTIALAKAEASDAESLSLYRNCRDRLEASASALRERVDAALTDACRMSAILLMAGEMTAQERRTARAVANGIASKIRTALEAPHADN